MAETKREFAQIANVTNAYLPMIERELEGNRVNFSEYARSCVINAISAINTVLDTAGISFNDPQLDQSNVASTLLNIAALQLNPSANPSECYFQLRNAKKKVDGKDVWVKKIEMNIQGDGYDAILARFGRGVEKVYPFWEVRAGDHFEYPCFNGLEMTPPKWTPTGKGEVVRVVYPILHTDHTIHFYISEREDVSKNLLAHIHNNLMNETFGFAENRFKATEPQQKKIAEKKKEMMDRAKQLGLKALDDEVLAPFISPSWKEVFSRESMLIRKMRNNVTRKIPKDFGSSYAMEKFEEMTNDAYANVKQEIIDGASAVIVEEIAPSDEQEGGSEAFLVEPRRETGEEARMAAEGVTERLKPDFA